MREIFIDVKGYEGYYKVSNLGRVKSLERSVKKRNGVTQSFKERMLKLCVDGTGYMSVALTGKSFRVHQLVAVAFLNHKPNGHTLVVDHKDNNKLNNNSSNLAIVTQRANLSRLGGTSKYVGVSWNKENRKWHSKTRLNGKQIHLGYFNDEIEASNAYSNFIQNI